MPTMVHVNDQQGMVFFLEPNMKTGLEVIDQDNDKLFKIINKLNLELYKSPYRIEQTLDLFKSLMKFGIEHFELEERLIESIDYPADESEHHIGEHRMFLRKIKQLIDELGQHKMIEVLEFLNRWLNEHVLKTDKAFAKAYLTQHAV